MSYQWRPGTRTGGVSADVAGEELERVRDANEGQLMPPDVVDAAKPKAAPLHPAFEWNNAAAADQWRLNQARQLIRSIRVVPADGAEDAPAYVHIKRTDAEDPYYQSTQVAVQQVDEWAAAIHGLTAKLNSLSRALDDLRRIAGQSERTNAAAVIGLASQALATVEHAIDKLAA